MAVTNGTQIKPVEGLRGQCEVLWKQSSNAQRRPGVNGTGAVLSQIESAFALMWPMTEGPRGVVCAVDPKIAFAAARLAKASLQVLSNHDKSEYARRFVRKAEKFLEAFERHHYSKKLNDECELLWLASSEGQKLGNGTYGAFLNLEKAFARMHLLIKNGNGNGVADPHAAKALARCVRANVRRLEGDGENQEIVRKFNAMATRFVAEIEGCSQTSAHKPAPDRLEVQ